jgi:hypothetical protein
MEEENKKEILTKVEYPDSLELDFGGTRKGGKLYFNASNVEEAKTRLNNMKDIAIEAYKAMKEFETKTKEE